MAFAEVPSHLVRRLQRKPPRPLLQSGLFYGPLRAPPHGERQRFVDSLPLLKIAPRGIARLTCKTCSKLKRTRREARWWRMWRWVMTAGCVRWRGRCSFLFVISKPSTQALLFHLNASPFLPCCSPSTVTATRSHHRDGTNSSDGNKSQ